MKRFIISIVAIFAMQSLALAAPMQAPPATPWDNSLPAPSLIIVPDGVDVGNPPGLNISQRDVPPAVDPKTIPWQAGDPAVKIAPSPGSSNYDIINFN